MNKLDPAIKLVSGKAVKDESKGLKGFIKNSKTSRNSLDKITISEISKNKTVLIESKK